MDAKVILVLVLVIIAGAAALMADARRTQIFEAPAAVEVDVPRMERVGEVGIGHDKLRLWAFEFEGRQCLWGTATVGRGPNAGLTCDWSTD